MRSKPDVFTSWKEIASYLGKGVRTVQRWEAQLGLPVRRPDAGCKGSVRATKDELDVWINAHWRSRERPLKCSARSEVETLRRTIAELTEENVRLRRELQESHESGFSAGFASGQLDGISVLLRRCEQLRYRTAQLHQQFAETMDMAKNLRALRQQTTARRPDIQRQTYEHGTGYSLPAIQGND